MGFSAHGAAGEKRVGPLDVPSDVVELVGSWCRGSREKDQAFSLSGCLRCVSVNRFFSLKLLVLLILNSFDFL